MTRKARDHSPVRRGYKHLHPADFSTSKISRPPFSLSIHRPPTSPSPKSPADPPPRMKLQREEASPAPIPPPLRRLSLDAAVFTRDRYKLCALAALLLLALWSMLTGSITLKSSAVDPVSLIYSSASSAPDDLDVLEVAEREKLVKKLWNVYSHGYGGIGNKIRLPSFWEEAFRAAYENMVSDSPAVRDDAVVEIAKMSLISMDLLPSPTQSSGAGETGKLTSRKLKI